MVTLPRHLPGCGYVLRAAGLVEMHPTRVEAVIDADAPAAKRLRHVAKLAGWAPLWAFQYERYLAGQLDSQRARIAALRTAAATSDGIERARAFLGLVDPRL